ncbi:hypothetical protein CONLIGDRAFT_681458 [Coniochaeta ligniaria NRRL 30616]|uniref:Uncharacterized protein n=1 Tax=Coniochaeta ligniaria NRRL 30616 TaxID=1408157 RepID=A0A1J7JFL8_9PEZI|nr:hypothetical protein CONLIGDRAFT_681458 [Coniochaeta ligniaria NRRL 30616]
MSSPAQGGPAVPKDKEKRLSRVLTRVKTVFKKSEGKRPTKAEPSTAAAGTTAATTSAPVEAEASTSKPTAETTKAPKTPDGAIKIPRAQIFEERAKKLSERFGIEITPSEWHSTEGHALRVEKPIRMRVHRECHKCGHNFGLAKECPNCKHPRCKECQRKPAKRSEAEKAESRKKRAALDKERAENPPIIADWDLSGKKVTLTRPSKQGGQDLVHKKPRQRVRRTCCQCSSLFHGAEKTCPGCQHPRCTDCPRDPAKKDRYPYGYPGDEFGPKSIPHYECHECKTKFPPNPPDGTECAKCSHKKCESCPRLTPRKVEPEPDPEVWKRVQERLGALDIKDK